MQPIHLMDSAIEALERRMSAMPPVAAMQVRVEGLAEHGGLCLHAPLAANVNDKGCAFGGSLAGLMTLACWGSVTLALERAGLGAAEVFVQDSSIEYLTPLYEDLRAEARLEPGQGWTGLVRAFRERGRARARLAASIRSRDGTLAARLDGRFVALARS